MVTALCDNPVIRATSVRPMGCLVRMQEKTLTAAGLAAISSRTAAAAAAVVSVATMATQSRLLGSVERIAMGTPSRGPSAQSLRTGWAVYLRIPSERVVALWETLMSALALKQAWNSGCKVSTSCWSFTVGGEGKTSWF